MAKKKTIKYLENGEYHDATVKDVGVIEELKTESKDNLVEAINEIFLGGGKGFSDLQQKVDESTQAAQNAQQAANNLQQRLDEVAQNVGISEEEAQKIINQAVEDAKRAQAEALQAYKDAQKELDDSMAQFMEEQKAINRELEQAKTDIQGDINQKNTEIKQINAIIESTKSDLTATSAQLASVRNDLTNAQMDWGKVRTEITNINGKLDSKMSNIDFDEYKERIERNETEVTQTKNELQSKATKQDLDVLTGTVTTQGSNITQLAGKLEGKVSKDTLANDIDDFQVKKANLFTGTREFMDWQFGNNALGRVNDDIYNHSKVAELHNGSNLSITVDGLEVGKTYSVSIFAKVDHMNSGSGGVQLMVDNGTSFLGVMKTVYTPHDTKVTTNWQRYYATIVASATIMKFVFDRYGMASDTTLYLNRPKLEVGETVYAWEDNAQDIYKRVEHTEAQFDVYNDQISGIVQRQTETDKKIENVRSTFTQRADGIEANSKKYTDDKTTGLAEEFSGRLKATSQELSTEYEKQTNAKIGALADGGTNLILNSSFLITDDNGNPGFDNWQDVSAKVGLTTPSGLDGTWIKSNRSTTGTLLGARTNYFPVKQGKLVVGVDIALDGNGDILPYVLRIEYYDVSNNRANYVDVTLQNLGLSTNQITKSGSSFRYARGVYKTSNDRSDVVKACIVVPETVTGYDMYLTNFFAKFSDVNDGTYEVNPLDQQASLIKQRTKIEQDSEKIELLNTQTEKLGNDIKATNTSVNVLKGEVDLKASQSTVNDLTSRVDKNEADIKVFPDRIKSEVSEVNKKVDGVNDKVDNIKVGGTNLLKDSLVPLTASNVWINNGVSNQIVDDYVRIRGNGDNNRIYQAFSNNGLNADDYYSISFYAGNDNNNEEFDVQVGTWGSLQTVHITGSTLKLYKLENVWLGGNPIFSVVVPFNKVVRLKKIKLEKGTIATDWSPAPEDTDASIESVKTVATQTKDGFDRLTEKTGYNASTGEFSKVTTQINEGINGVSTQVASVSNRLDNLSVGGTNLAKHTSNTLTNRMQVSKWVFVASGSNVANFNLDNYKGQTLTMRAWIDKPTVDAHLQVWTNASNNGYAVGNTIKAGQSGYSSLTFKVPSSFTAWNIAIGNGKAAEIAYKEFKVEKGTIATDWSPAPEDLQEGINTATTKTTQTDTKFERMISQIQYNDSTGEIGKYEHKITELANGTQEKISALTKRGNNMVIKSSFDDGTDLGGWYVASVYGTDFYRTTTTPKPDEMSSNYCLASGTRDALEANNIFPVVSGTKYYISAWVYTSRKYSGKVGLYVKNSNNNNVTHLGVEVPKDDQNRWIKIKGTITIPNGYNIAQPWLQVEKMVSDNEKIYFADISITRADDNAIELSETMTTRIGDLEKTVRTNTTNLGQYRQEMTNSAQELSTKFTSYQNLVQNDVAGVKNRLDNLSVGGTNLVANSGNPQNIDGWSINGTNPNHKLIVWSHPFWKNSQENLFGLFNQNSSEVTMSSKRIKVERNTDYTLSYWAFEDWRVVSSDTFFLGRKNGETSDFTKINNLVNGRVYSGSRAEYVSVTFNTGEYDEGYIRFDNNGSKEVGKDAVLFLANIKLEKGNKATDWSPAPEDTDNKIEILQGQITANANKFNTVYTKTDVDNKISPLNSRTEFLQDNSKFLLRVTQAGAATKADVNSANSKIGDLSTRVTNTEVAITSGGVTINGDTTIGKDFTLSADRIKAGTMQTKGLVMSNELGSKIEFTQDGLDIQKADNREAYYTFGGQGMDFWRMSRDEAMDDYPDHHKPGYVHLGSMIALDNEYTKSVNRPDQQHTNTPSNNNGIGFILDVTGGADNFAILQKGAEYRKGEKWGRINFNETVNNSHFPIWEINATGYGSHAWQQSGFNRGRGIFNYSNLYFYTDPVIGTEHDPGGKDYFPIERIGLVGNDGYGGMAIWADNQNVVSIRTDDEYPIVANGMIVSKHAGADDSVFVGGDGRQWLRFINRRNVRADVDKKNGSHYTNFLGSVELWELKYGTLTHTSQLSRKTDVSPIDINDLSSKLLSIDLFKYKYKSQKENEKYRYGGIIDDVNRVKKYNLPQEFISTNGEGIDDSNLITGLIATAKIQAREIEKLNFRILELERGKING